MIFSCFLVLVVDIYFLIFLFLFVFNISCLFVLDFLNLTSCFFHSYFLLIAF
ncbi:hypothetical protein HMPREF1397_00640 [Helicobacter pylori GAM115Ai]|nr:hypothetical protein HMPREF1397_00640 [Helicobacter pylori GAM115Ai]